MLRSAVRPVGPRSDEPGAGCPARSGDWVPRPRAARTRARSAAARSTDSTSGQSGRCGPPRGSSGTGSRAVRDGTRSASRPRRRSGRRSGPSGARASDRRSTASSVRLIEARCGAPVGPSGPDLVLLADLPGRPGRPHGDAALPPGTLPEARPHAPPDPLAVPALPGSRLRRLLRDREDVSRRASRSWSRRRSCAPQAPRGHGSTGWGGRTSTPGCSGEGARSSWSCCARGCAPSTSPSLAAALGRRRRGAGRGPGRPRRRRGGRGRA